MLDDGGLVEWIGTVALAEQKVVGPFHDVNWAGKGRRGTDAVGEGEDLAQSEGLFVCVGLSED